MSAGYLSTNLIQASSIIPRRERVQSQHRFRASSRADSPEFTERCVRSIRGGRITRPNRTEILTRMLVAMYTAIPHSRTSYRRTPLTSPVAPFLPRNERVSFASLSRRAVFTLIEFNRRAIDFESTAIMPAAKQISREIVLALSLQRVPEIFARADPRASERARSPLRRS